MIKTIKRVLAGLLVVPTLAFSALALPVAVPVSAAGSCPTTGVGTSPAANGAACSQPAGTNADLFGQNSIFTTIVNILLFIIGAVAVIMLIYGGIRYTISAGREKEVEAAKNTILYAVIGIVIAFLAYAVVNWVLTSLTNS